jgi:hypothetical protein
MPISINYTRWICTEKHTWNTVSMYWHINAYLRETINYDIQVYEFIRLSDLSRNTIMTQNISLFSIIFKYYHDQFSSFLYYIIYTSNNILPFWVKNVYYFYTPWDFKVIKRQYWRGQHNCLYHNPVIPVLLLMNPRLHAFREWSM